MESSDQGLYSFSTPRNLKQFMRTLWPKNLKFHRLWQMITFRLLHKAKAHGFSSILALPYPPPPTHTQTPFIKNTFKKREVKLLFTACLKKRSSFFLLHQTVLSNLWGRYDQKKLKFHRWWQIIAFSLLHKAKCSWLQFHVVSEGNAMGPLHALGFTDDHSHLSPNRRFKWSQTNLPLDSQQVKV